METIRGHADEIPFWPRRRRVGRPGTDEHVPDHSAMPRKLSSVRWSTLLTMFFEHIIGS